MKAWKIAFALLAVSLFFTQAAFAAQGEITFQPVTAAATQILNVVNGGAAAQGENCTYYCNNGIWCKPDDGDAYMLWEDYATALYLDGEKLYYTDGEHGDALYCRQLPDGEKEEIVPFSTECFQRIGDQLVFYCARRLEHRGIYTCHSDGTHLQKLASTNCTFLFAWDDQIYFTDKDNGSHLMRMKKDGTGKTDLISSYVYCAFVNDSENKIYYSTTEGFYRCNMDGRKSEMLLPLPAYRFNASGDELFLSAYSYKGNANYPVGIFRIHSGEAAASLLRISEDQAACLAIGSNMIYYKSMTYSLTLMRMGADGSEPTYVAGGEALSPLDQIEQAGNEAASAND